MQVHGDIGLDGTGQRLAGDLLGLSPVTDAVERVSEVGGQAVAPGIGWRKSDAPG